MNDVVRVRAGLRVRGRLGGVVSIRLGLGRLSLFCFVSSEESCMSSRHVIEKSENQRCSRCCSTGCCCHSHDEDGGIGMWRGRGLINAKQVR